MSIGMGVSCALPISHQVNLLALRISHQAIVLKLTKRVGNVPGGKSNLPCCDKIYPPLMPMSLRGIAEAISSLLKGEG